MPGSIYNILLAGVRTPRWHDGSIGIELFTMSSCLLCGHVTHLQMTLLKPPPNLKVLAIIKFKGGGT